MKKIFLTLIVIVLGLGSYAQKQTCSGPDKNFMVAFDGAWGKFDYAVVQNVVISGDQSNIIHINQGGPGIYISYAAFLNTTPCFTLGFVRATIVVYNNKHQAYKSATVQLNNLFYYDYPLNLGAYMYCLYTIPNGSWTYSRFQIDPPATITD